jgi:hypothetical protein
VSTPGDRYQCACDSPRLIAVIGGQAVSVNRAFAGDPLSRLYCARCRGRYVGPWHTDRPSGH